jgi:hypothetical protein
MIEWITIELRKEWIDVNSFIFYYLTLLFCRLNNVRFANIYFQKYKDNTLEWCDFIKGYVKRLEENKK